jgi:hypothetical protein
MNRAAVFATVSLAAALVGIAFACGNSSITIATIVADAGRDARCEISDGGDGREPCPPGQFCSRTLCGSKDGVCESVDSDGCAASEPECGCDRINYFNSCLRQEAHASKAGTGQCGGQMLIPPIPCGFRLPPCPNDNASCAFIVPIPDLAGIPCEYPDAGGTCWSLPKTCPTDAPRSVQACGGRCIDECSAIRQGGFYLGCSDASAP